MAGRNWGVFLDSMRSRICCETSTTSTCGWLSCDRERQGTLSLCFLRYFLCASWATGFFAVDLLPRQHLDDDKANALCGMRKSLQVHFRVYTYAREKRRNNTTRCNQRKGR